MNTQQCLDKIGLATLWSYIKKYAESNYANINSTSSDVEQINAIKYEQIGDGLGAYRLSSQNNNDIR